MSENIGQMAGASNESMNSKPAKKRSIKKIIMYVLVAFVALVIGLAFFVDSATKAPVAASNKFLNAIQSSDATTAYALFSTAAKAAVPADQFDAVVKQIGPILNSTEKITSKKVGGSTGSAASAEVVYEINGTDGKTYAMTVNLTKENGEWKILNFDNKAQ